MAMVCFPIWGDDVLGLQLPLPPPCLPFQTLQFVLLAPRLCWHLPYDSLFILCSHLLCLLLQPLSTVLLSNLHNCAWCTCNHHPPCACFFHSSFQTFQGHPLPHHGFFRGDSCSTRSCPPLGASTYICIPRI